MKYGLHQGPRDRIEVLEEVIVAEGERLVMPNGVVDHAPDEGQDRLGATVALVGHVVRAEHILGHDLVAGVVNGVDSARIDVFVELLEQSDEASAAACLAESEEQRAACRVREDASGHAEAKERLVEALPLRREEAQQEAFEAGGARVGGGFVLKDGRCAELGVIVEVDPVRG